MHIALRECSEEIMKQWATRCASKCSMDKTAQSKIVVYTAIFGGYDALLDPAIVEDGVDYVCFTDDPTLNSDIWNVVLVSGVYRDHRRTAKAFKILPHVWFQNYDFSVWIDGRLHIQGGISELVRAVESRSAFACFSHPNRSCAYTEGMICILHGKDRVLPICQQMLKYSRQRYPKKSGLFAGGLIVRKHNVKEIIHAMELWAEEIDSHSVRDQLSLGFVAWKCGLKIQTFDGDLWDNKYFKVKTHAVVKYFDSKGKEYRTVRGFLSALYSKLRTNL